MADSNTLVNRASVSSQLTSAKSSYAAAKTRYTSSRSRADRLAMTRAGQNVSKYARRLSSYSGGAMPDFSNNPNVRVSKSSRDPSATIARFYSSGASPRLTKKITYYGGGRSKTQRFSAARKPETITTMSQRVGQVQSYRSDTREETVTRSSISDRKPLMPSRTAENIARESLPTQFTTLDIMGRAVSRERSLRERTASPYQFERSSEALRQEQLTRRVGRRGAQEKFVRGGAAVGGMAFGIVTDPFLRAGYGIQREAITGRVTTPTVIAGVEAGAIAGGLVGGLRVGTVRARVRNVRPTRTFNRIMNREPTGDMFMPSRQAMTPSGDLVLTPPSQTPIAAVLPSGRAISSRGYTPEAITTTLASRRSPISASRLPDSNLIPATRVATERGTVTTAPEIGVARSGNLELQTRLNLFGGDRRGSLTFGRQRTTFGRFPTTARSSGRLGSSRAPKSYTVPKNDFIFVNRSAVGSRSGFLFGSSYAAATSSRSASRSSSQSFGSSRAPNAFASLSPTRSRIVQEQRASSEQRQRQGQQSFLITNQRSASSGGFFGGGSGGFGRVTRATPPRPRVVGGAITIPSFKFGGSPREKKGKKKGYGFAPSLITPFAPKGSGVKQSVSGLEIRSF